MKKRLFIALTLLLGTFLAPATAAEPAQPSIAVIDVGMNLFKESVTTEACFVEYGTCPNGKKEMVGPGAANLPTQKVNSLFDHGTQMASVILSVNPKAKLIPIRIMGTDAQGTSMIYSLEAVTKALDWIIANQATYNIQVVNISQGGIKPNCEVPSNMKKQVATLKTMNVPVISATGNNSNYQQVNSPACLDDVVSVGATDNPYAGGGFMYDKDAKPTIAKYSNGWASVDFYLNGRWYVTNLNGSRKFSAGTSNATASLSAWWLLNKKNSFDETYNSILSTTTQINNQYLSGKYVYLPFAPLKG